jgi:hypothetical protein
LEEGGEVCLGVFYRESITDNTYCVGYRDTEGGDESFDEVLEAKAT